MRMKELAVAVIGTLAVAQASFAAPIAGVESGNTRATAQNVSAFFTPDSDPNVYGTGVPTVSVAGALTLNDADFYSFSGLAGQDVYIDLDDTELLFDTYLGLFSSTGKLLAISDDTVAPTDPGSPPRDSTAGASSRASFIGTFTLPTTETYFVSVTDFGNRPANRSGTGITQSPLTRPDGVTTSSLFINSAIIGAPDGGDALLTSTSTNAAARTGSYTLHISAVPEPTSLSLLALGGLCLVRRRRQA